MSLWVKHLFCHISYQRGGESQEIFKCNLLPLWFFLLLDFSSHNSSIFKELTVYACQDGRLTMTRVVFSKLYPQNVSMLFRPRGLPKFTPHRKQVQRFSLSFPRPEQDQSQRSTQGDGSLARLP